MTLHYDIPDLLPNIRDLSNRIGNEPCQEGTEKAAELREANMHLQNAERFAQEAKMKDLQSPQRDSSKIDESVKNEIEEAKTQANAEFEKATQLYEHAKTLDKSYSMSY